MSVLRAVYDGRFGDHDDPGKHPERSQRLLAILDALRVAGLEAVLEEARATDEPWRHEAQIARVHDRAYLAFLRDEISGRRGFLNADTFYAPASVEVAWRAAAELLALTAAVLDGEVTRALALVRPPGHHAERRRGKGFCFLNNVAVAAAEARARGARVAVVDFDVHHGDGTQQAFWEDPDLLFISVHRWGRGIYPGTGSVHERGAEAGEGATINLPMSAGADRAAYLEVFDQGVRPSLERFAPDLLFVSAGFDAHDADPLSDTHLDDVAYDEIIARLCAWSEKCCDGRMVVSLEGGYDLASLGRGVVTLLRRMLGMQTSAAAKES